MIVDLLVSAVLGALGAIFGLAPVWEPPSSLFESYTAMGLLGSIHNNTEDFLPWDTVVQVGAIAIGFRLLVGAFHLAVWLYDRFPFKAT